MDLSGLLFLLAVLLGGASFLCWDADGATATGSDWADSVCTTAPMFCHHPEYLAYAGVTALVIALGAKLGSSLSG